MTKEMTDNVKDFINNWSESNREDFYKIADELWENPELSMQEHFSAELLCAFLEKNGFSVERGVAGMPTAFVASYGQGKPVIGLNAEYVALPGLSQDRNIIEKKEKVQGGPGQGCGHNLLGTAAIKAALSLSKAMEKFGLKGTIKIFGTPAEELCLGKAFMGKAGCFKGVDAFLDWHPWSYNRADYDSCCSYFSVKFHFKGRACHGNSPWHGRSALDALMLQAHAVEMMREHIYPGNPPDGANTINYTVVDPGPEFPSVVPDRATAWYIGRFITTEDGEEALRRITNCAKGAALATETEVSREIITATNHKIPNKALASIMHDNFQKAGMPQFTPEEQEKAKEIQRQMNCPETGMAKSLQEFQGGYSVVCDTSEFSWNGPYATVWVAMAPENIGWHNWGVASCAGGSQGRKSMDIGALVIAFSAADLLCEDHLLIAAKQEFEERLAGRKYKCILPENAAPPVELNKEVMEKYKVISRKEMK